MIVVQKKEVTATIEDTITTTTTTTTIQVTTVLVDVIAIFTNIACIHHIMENLTTTYSCQ